MADFAQVEARRGGQSQFEHHRAEKIAVTVEILLYHVFRGEAFQHPVHGGPLQRGAGGEVEQARAVAIVSGDLAQQRQRALDALRSGKFAGRRIGSSWHGSSPNREISTKLCH
ncbi:hypothetical protein D3C83_13850 [compost metagenome]